MPKSLGINFCNLHATQAMLYILTLLTTVSSDIEVHGDEKFSNHNRLRIGQVQMEYLKLAIESYWRVLITTKFVGKQFPK